MQKNILTSILSLIILILLISIYHLHNNYQQGKLQYEKKLNKLENMIEAEREESGKYENELYQCKARNWEIEKISNHKTLKESEVILHTSENNICTSGWKLWKNNTYWFQACLPNEWNWIHSWYWFYTELLHDKTNGIWNTDYINESWEDKNIIYIQDTQYGSSWIENKKIVLHSETKKVEDWFDKNQKYVWSDLTLTTKTHEIRFTYNKDNELQKQIIDSIIYD